MESILVIFFNEFERMHERRSKYKQAYALYMWKMSWVDKDPGQAKCRLCVLCGGKTFNLSNVCVRTCPCCARWDAMSALEFSIVALNMYIFHLLISLNVWSWKSIDENV